MILFVSIALAADPLPERPVPVPATPNECARATPVVAGARPEIVDDRGIARCGAVAVPSSVVAGYLLTETWGEEVYARARSGARGGAGGRTARGGVVPRAGDRARGPGGVGWGGGGRRGCADGGERFRGQPRGGVGHPGTAPASAARTTSAASHPSTAARARTAPHSASERRIVRDFAPPGVAVPSRRWALWGRRGIY